MQTNIIRTIVSSFAVVTLFAAPGMAIEKKNTRKVNSNVHLGMTSKAPYAMKRISKAEMNLASKPEAHKKTNRPTSMKPGQFAKANPAPAAAETPTAMNAD